MLRLATLSAIIIMAFTAKAQVTSDTLTYEGDCLKKTGTYPITITLENDTLSISGSFWGNCCGTHLFVVEYFNDSISITKPHSGMLCDCTCTFDYAMSLDGCTASAYHLYLSENFLYGDTLTLDTTIYASDLHITDQSNNNEVKVYPNPTSGQLHIVNNNHEIKTISIRNLHGQTIKKNINLHRPVNLENLEPGVYILTIETNTQTINRKVLKE